MRNALLDQLTKCTRCGLVHSDTLPLCVHVSSGGWCLAGLETCIVLLHQFQAVCAFSLPDLAASFVLLQQQTDHAFLQQSRQQPCERR